jgi:hypothetical protein
MGEPMLGRATRAGPEDVLTRTLDADLLGKTMRVPEWTRSGSMRFLAFAISAAIVARPTPSVACRERPYRESFPVEELQGYSTVAVVKVGKVDPPAGRFWVPPFRATLNVVKPLKGKLRRGEAIEAASEPYTEDHAVCAIRLEEGSTYLLFFKGDSSPYLLPRFGSLYVEDKDKLFKRYVEAIEKASGLPVSNEPDKSAGSTDRCSAAPLGATPSGAFGWLALAGAVAWLRRRRPARKSSMRMGNVNAGR